LTNEAVMSTSLFKPNSHPTTRHVSR